MLAVADEGAKVRIVVTATNPEGSVASASAATATVQAAPPVNTSPPVVTRHRPARLTLTATQGSLARRRQPVTATSGSATA